MKLQELTDALRAAGVHAVSFPREMTLELSGMHFAVSSLELEPTHDTIPAPSLEPELEAEQKSPGMCAVPGCRESAGFHFAPHLCRDHGMGQLGVKT